MDLRFPALKSPATRSAASGLAFSCFLMAVYNSLSSVLVPASVCGGNKTAMKNIDENYLGKKCGLQFIMRYSTSGEQNLESSLDFVHQLLFTNVHRPLMVSKKNTYSQGRRRDSDIGTNKF